jgi:hypothetical protein
MDYFECRRFRSQYMFSGSEDEESYSEPIEPKTVKNTSERFQALYVARDHFSEFVNTLGQIRHT